MIPTQTSGSVRDYDNVPKWRWFHPLQRLVDLPKPHKEHLVNLREEPEQFYACVTLTGAQDAVPISHFKTG